MEGCKWRQIAWKEDRLFVSGAYVQPLPDNMSVCLSSWEMCWCLRKWGSLTRLVTAVRLTWQRLSRSLLRCNLECHGTIAWAAETIQVQKKRRIEPAWTAADNTGEAAVENEHKQPGCTKESDIPAVCHRGLLRPGNHPWKCDADTSQNDQNNQWRLKKKKKRRRKRAEFRRGSDVLESSSLVGKYVAGEPAACLAGIKYTMERKIVRGWQKTKLFFHWNWRETRCRPACASRSVTGGSEVNAGSSTAAAAAAAASWSGNFKLKQSAHIWLVERRCRDAFMYIS